MQDGAIRGTLMREAERAEQYGVCDFGIERAVWVGAGVWKWRFRSFENLAPLLRTCMVIKRLNTDSHLI